MALSADQSRKYVVSGADAIGVLPVLTGVTLYLGAFLSQVTASGYIRGATAGGTDTFAGMLIENQVVNAGASGSKFARVLQDGTVHGLSITGYTTVADVDKPVYASDDGTLTGTASTNVLIGRTSAFDPVTSTFSVKLKAASHR